MVQSRGELAHNGITLAMEGAVNLQLSAKSVGVFEAFYNSIKPIQLVNYSLEIAKPGKLYHSILFNCVFVWLFCVVFIDHLMSCIYASLVFHLDTTLNQHTTTILLECIYSVA